MEVQLTHKFLFLASLHHTTPVLLFSHVNIISGASRAPAASGRRRRRSSGRGSPGRRCPARTPRRCRRRRRRVAGRPASGGPRPWAGRGAPARTTGGTPAPARRNPAPRRTTTGRPASSRCSRASRCQPAKLDGASSSGWTSNSVPQMFRNPFAPAFRFSGKHKEQQDKLCTTSYNFLNKLPTFWLKNN
jgi:hypothetical protein